MNIFVPEYIQSLKPYRSGNQVEGGISREKFKSLINLASNENQLGTSQAAKIAINNSLDESNIYPEPSALELRQALARHFAKDADCFVAGNGSDSLIAYIFNAFTSEGDEILSSDGTFIGAYVNANKMGRKLNLVPLNDYNIDLNVIANKITSNTKLIYLANPNNPTATMFGKVEFEQFMSKVPNNIIVILDEAYSLYAEKYDTYPRGMDYNYDNLIVLQTLSKTHGLAGLRVGYCYCKPNLAEMIMKVKLPFEPNILAQNAAIAALEDKEFIEKTLEVNETSLKMFADTFSNLGFKYRGGYANFFMLIFDNQLEAKSFTSFMLEHRIVVRHLAMFGLNECVRISSGTLEQTEIAVDAIKIFIENQKG